MTMRTGRASRVRKVKTAQQCVFCNGAIKKGQDAISRLTKVFEHLTCYDASYGYLGEQGVLERNLMGVPRCHLCGWYQERLDLHIMNAHEITEGEYRSYFLGDSEEELLSFIQVEHSSENLLELEKKQSEETSAILQFHSSKNLRGSSQRSWRKNNMQKRDNPLNKKPKKKLPKRGNRGPS